MAADVAFESLYALKELRLALSLLRAAAAVAASVGLVWAPEDKDGERKRKITRIINFEDVYQVQ